jgi:hypothetical protein
MVRLELKLTVNPDYVKYGQPTGPDEWSRVHVGSERERGVRKRHAGWSSGWTCEWEARWIVSERM